MSTGEFTLEQRAAYRLLHTELRAQSNIDRTVYYAAIELQQAEDVSSDPVDDDWITRFFGIVEEITTDRMQKLWGTILAGEVKKPGSFSLRTLDVLRNLSQSEAVAFGRLAELVLSSPAAKDTPFVAVIANFDRIQKLVGLTLANLLRLQDAGLLVVDTTLVTNVESNDPTGNPPQVTLLNGKLMLLMVFKKNKHKVPLKAVILTEAGTELLPLLDPVGNREYLQMLADLMKGHWSQSFTATVTGFTGDQILYKDKVAIEPASSS